MFVRMAERDGKCYWVSLDVGKFFSLKRNTFLTTCILAPPCVDRSTYQPKLNHEIPVTTYIQPKQYVVRPRTAPSQHNKSKPIQAIANGQMVKKYSPISPRIVALSVGRHRIEEKDKSVVRKGFLDYERAERVKQFREGK